MKNTTSEIRESLLPNQTFDDLTVNQRVALLCEMIPNLDRAGNVTWLNTLEERKRAEADFHDEREDRQLTKEEFESQAVEKPNKKYYRYTNRSRDYLSAWLAREVPGKVFLDYACGDGQHTIRAAQHGAALAIGLDISAVSIATAKRSAASVGVGEKTEFFQGDCEATGLPDRSVDVILCCGMLHHLDLEKAYPELDRILAPGGKIIAYEALNYNPAIKLYRRLTPELRTEWEAKHILSLKDVKLASRYFNVGEIRYWNLFGILSPHLPFLAPVFDFADSFLTRIPGVQLMSWIFTFELLKRSDRESKKR